MTPVATERQRTNYCCATASPRPAVVWQVGCQAAAYASSVPGACEWPQACSTGLCRVDVWQRMRESAVVKVHHPPHRPVGRPAGSMKAQTHHSGTLMCWQHPYSGRKYMLHACTQRSAQGRRSARPSHAGHHMQACVVRHRAGLTQAGSPGWRAGRTAARRGSPARRQPLPAWQWSACLDELPSDRPD